jgi:hypothetical protein
MQILQYRLEMRVFVATDMVSMDCHPKIRTAIVPVQGTTTKCAVQAGEIVSLGQVASRPPTMEKVTLE